MRSPRLRAPRRHRLRGPGGVDRCTRSSKHPSSLRLVVRRRALHSDRMALPRACCLYSSSNLNIYISRESGSQAHACPAGHGASRACPIEPCSGRNAPTSFIRPRCSAVSVARLTSSAMKASFEPSWVDGDCGGLGHLGFLRITVAASARRSVPAARRAPRRARERPRCGRRARRCSRTGGPPSSTGSRRSAMVQSAAGVRAGRRRPAGSTQIVSGPTASDAPMAAPRP